MMVFSRVANTFIRPSRRSARICQTASPTMWTSVKGIQSMPIHNRRRHRPPSRREILALGGLGLLWLAAAMFCIAALSTTVPAATLEPADIAVQA